MGKSTLFFAAGHQGGNAPDRDRGNVSVAGVIEADELVAIVGTMRRWVSGLGIAQGLGGVVFLDDALALQGQIEVLNEWKPTAADHDMCIDWHLDYKPNTPAGGALVIYDDAPLSQRFAEVWLQRWCKATGIVSNGCHLSTVAAPAWRNWPDFGFCRPAWPGIIVEMGCLSTPRDLAIVRDPFYRALAAQLAIDVWRELAA